LTYIPTRVGLHDNEGNPSAIRPPGENGQTYYSEKFQPPSVGGFSAESALNSTSNSGFLDVQDSRGGRFVIKKGKTSILAPTGTDIFKEVNEQGENSGFVKRIRQLQFDNNRFTLGKTYVPRSGLELAEGISVQTPGSDGSRSVTEDESNIGVAYAQQDFGKHGPRKFPTAQGDTATLLKIKDLKKIGLLTMLQASGEYYVPTDPTDVVQQLAARGAALAPGLARIGQKINMTRVSPIKIMKDIHPDYQKPNLDDNIKKDEVLSYGSVNNWMTPFSGLSSTASIACAALLTLTVGLLLKGAALIVAPSQLPAPELLVSNPSKDSRRRRIGSYLGKANQTDAFRNTDFSINVFRTSHDYALCVSRGIDVFFGRSSLGLQTVKVVQNHGYYNTILRSLIRGTRDMIMLAAGGIVNPSGVSDINDVGLLGNPLGPIELIQKLNESHLLRFCNIMASIGDVSISHERKGYVLNDHGEIDEFITEVDRIVVEGNVGPNNQPSLNPAVLQSVNRLPQKYRNALAWGSNTSKSMYLVPNGLSVAESNYLGSQNQTGNPSERLIADLTANGLHVVKGPNNLNGRISAEDVAAMEEHLNADYMPFYFHDIRTNEIISFHAFLEDMNDSFDAEYTDVEGYGRIGSAHIYKNTKRSISLGFRVVATNEKDFDHMWYKINKLITLVYPQYTEGREVGTGASATKFIQPFSQLPSASPMVRMRLGDLFKTNYSRFALARLFGVGSSRFAIESQTNTVQYDRDFQAAREGVANRMGYLGDYLQGEFAMLLPLVSGGGAGAGQRILGYPCVGALVDTPSQPGQSARRGVGGRTGAGIEGAFTVSESRASIARVGSPAGSPLRVDQQMRVRIVGVDNNGETKLYRFTVPNGGVGRDGVYMCSQNDLTPDAQEVARVAQATLPARPTATGSEFRTAVSSFFSPEGANGNPIIKAFESTQGKGLAGFIKSLKFDWSDARWETRRHNARAPMSVKISMEFAPIFDINPGLDSNGFMTAPVYNVGDTVKIISTSPDQMMVENRARDALTNATAIAAPRSSNGSGT
jgi:hypothetical protein